MVILIIADHLGYIDKKGVKSDRKNFEIPVVLLSCERAGKFKNIYIGNINRNIRSLSIILHPIFLYTPTLQSQNKLIKIAICITI